VNEAVERLSQQVNSKAARELAQANLPLLQLRRALDSLEKGDSAGAQRDVELAEKFQLSKQPELSKLAAFTRALVYTEDKRFGDATAALKKALTPAPRWAAANTRALTEAYILYRKEQVPQARKTLAAASKKPSGWQAKWVAALSYALNRVEGERAYTAGNFKLAEKAFKAALATEPDNAVLQHNLACVAYRQGKAAAAVAEWRKLEASVSTATLNLGIDAQERRNDIPEAVESYRRYLASSGGPRMATVKEWKDRLVALYGLNGSASDIDSNSNSNEATATETLP
jgi:tetratricopeptide (TPR) repeat protein